VRAPQAAIGEFRCPVGHPSFRDSGPIQECIVVFPRTSVWIRHEGSDPFVADPNVVTIYNRLQVYDRLPLSSEGDRSDWFALSDDLAREVTAAFDPAAAWAERPFRFEWARSVAPLYLRQRTLLQRAKRGEVDSLELEEEVMSIVAEVLARAYREQPRPLARRASAARRRRDLTEATRAELLRDPRLNRSMQDLGRSLGTSPFHLCRVFRAVTGMTIHRYRSELRVRLALEMLEDSRDNISAVAHDLGFVSHSHFVRAMREHVGATPSAVREALTGS
jgi:AraC-like DNA-binding protein